MSLSDLWVVWNMKVQEVDKRKRRKGQLIFVLSVSKFSLFYITSELLFQEAQQTLNNKKKTALVYHSQNAEHTPMITEKSWKHSEKK